MGSYEEFYHRGYYRKIQNAVIINIGIPYSESFESMKHLTNHFVEDVREVNMKEKRHKKDVERFAFLYLCGVKDKHMLLGKERMTFIDFERLTYLTDFFGLTDYNLEIWGEVCRAVQKSV